MWWYSCAYMVKLIFPYQHKNVAGQNRLELHNMLDHILFRWRRGIYLISDCGSIEQNKWLSSNKEIVLLGFLSFVAWMKRSLNSWQDDDFLSCRMLKRIERLFFVVKQKFLILLEPSLWSIIISLQRHSVSWDAAIFCAVRG